MLNTPDLFAADAPLAVANTKADSTVFAQWEAARKSDPSRPKAIGVQGLAQARLVWDKWSEFLALRGKSWSEAGPNDIAAFIEGIQPRARQTGRVNPPTSPVTKRRYWRIIRDIYAFAVLSTLLEENPAMADNVKPRESERGESFVLPFHAWISLMDQIPGGFTFKDRRNRLALMLMMRCGLTAGEIVDLSVGDVAAVPALEHQRATFGLPLLQPESPNWQATEAFPDYALQVSGRTKALSRTLFLDPRTSKALHDWMQVRVIGKERPPADHEKLLVGATEGEKLTARLLYNISAALFASSEEGREIKIRFGPNTLRNTCIVIWLNNGVTTTEVMRRCGAKDPGIVTRLLKQVKAEVRY
jgi:integrase